MAFNYTSYYQEIANYLGISLTSVIVLMAIISVWTLIWKGLALWKSSKKEHIIWFVIFLILNTAGILEILYIFIFSKMNLKSKNKKISSKKKSIKKSTKKK